MKHDDPNAPADSHTGDEGREHAPPAVTPGGPAATPDTPEGKQAAEDEGEEA